MAVAIDRVQAAKESRRLDKCLVQTLQDVICHRHMGGYQHRAFQASCQREPVRSPQNLVPGSTLTSPSPGETFKTPSSLRRLKFHPID